MLSCIVIFLLPFVGLTFISAENENLHESILNSELNKNSAYDNNDKRHNYKESDYKESKLLAMEKFDDYVDDNDISDNEEDASDECQEDYVLESDDYNCKWKKVFKPQQTTTPTNYDNTQPKEYDAKPRLTTIDMVNPVTVSSVASGTTQDHYKTTTIPQHSVESRECVENIEPDYDLETNFLESDQGRELAKKLEEKMVELASPMYKEMSDNGQGYRQYCLKTNGSKAVQDVCARGKVNYEKSRRAYRDLLLDHINLRLSLLGLEGERTTEEELEREREELEARKAEYLLDKELDHDLKS